MLKEFEIKAWFYWRGVIAWNKYAVRDETLQGAMDQVRDFMSNGFMHSRKDGTSIWVAPSRVLISDWTN